MFSQRKGWCWCCLQQTSLSGRRAHWLHFCRKVSQKRLTSFKRSRVAFELLGVLCCVVVEWIRAAAEQLLFQNDFPNIAEQLRREAAPFSRQRHSLIAPWSPFIKVKINEWKRQSKCLWGVSGRLLCGEGRDFCALFRLKPLDGSTESPLAVGQEIRCGNLIKEEGINCVLMINQMLNKYENSVWTVYKEII